MKMKNMIAAMSAVMISAASFAAMSITAAAETKDTYDFKLGHLFAGTVIDEHIQITEDGQYTITAAIPDAGDTTAGSLILFIDSDVNIYDYAMTDGGDGIKDGVIKFNIDSITVDGQPIAYTPSANAVTTGDDGNSLRCNIHNPYAGNVLDVPSELTGTETLAVTFTVSGLFGAEEQPTDAPTEAPTEAPTAAATTAAATTAAGATTAAATTTAATTAASNAATGESNGIALVVAGMAVAGAAAVMTRKRK